MKTVVAKPFVKVVVSDKAPKAVPQPKLTNGQKMNC